MGPPLSHRETRRSGRRSAPSVSKSVSKSPETELPPKQKEKEPTASRPPLSSNHSSRGSKRPKQEEIDENSEEQKSGSVSSNSTASVRSKRKAGTKEKQSTVEPRPPTPSEEDAGPPEAEQDEEEEQGVTRCVCGSTGEDDPDAGEFMVQCEGCKVWQHGLCMGFESEDQLPDDDYYCEECDPERHKERLSKRRSRRPRQTSAAANPHNNAVNNRVSRSHSPSSLRQPSKRRNTMNSRDAAFDESLKEVLEATAAEAAAQEVISGLSSDLRSEQDGAEEDNENVPNKKKRKRVEEEITSKKRTRSASTASEQAPSAVVQEEVPEPPKSMPPPKSTTRPNKRGGKKAPPPLAIDEASVDGDEGTAKRPAQSRSKSSQKSAQIPNSSGANQETGSRRGQGTPANATAPSGNMENTRGYRSITSAAQHSLYTSWGLPDYLAHLEPILPSNVPPPLEVRSSSTSQTVGKGDSHDLSVERGVKVKWPSKRMSVGDMNKRVRALVEWVGREQASALDRIRRQDALNRALQGDTSTHKENNGASIESGQPTNTARNHEGVDIDVAGSENASSADINRGLSGAQSSVTMRTMEELMEELIGFQERFGPGSKNRERRIVSN